MARPRQPLAVAKLKGTKKSRLNLHEPQFTGTPKCPSWLPLEAKREWRRAYAILEPFLILKATDQAVFAAYCVSFARWKSAEKIIDTEGQTVREPVISRSGHDTGKFKTKAHPAVAIARTERQMMQRLAATLGLDPSSRTRIAAGVDVDPLAPDDDHELDYLGL
jgi:P27 family predicted phage terminase small subunit